MPTSPPATPAPPVLRRAARRVMGPANVLANRSNRCPSTSCLLGRSGLSLHDAIASTADTEDPEGRITPRQDALALPGLGERAVSLDDAPRRGGRGVCFAGRRRWRRVAPPSTPGRPSFGGARSRPLGGRRTAAAGGRYGHHRPPLGRTGGSSGVGFHRSRVGPAPSSPPPSSAMNSSVWLGHGLSGPAWGTRSGAGRGWGGPTASAPKAM
jgi:hypothetical protein